MHHSWDPIRKSMSPIPIPRRSFLKSSTPSQSQMHGARGCRARWSHAGAVYGDGGCRIKEDEEKEGKGGVAQRRLERRRTFPRRAALPQFLPAPHSPPAGCAGRPNQAAARFAVPPRCLPCGAQTPCRGAQREQSTPSPQYFNVGWPHLCGKPS